MRTRKFDELASPPHAVQTGARGGRRPRFHVLVCRPREPASNVPRSLDRLDRFRGSLNLSANRNAGQPTSWRDWHEPGSCTPRWRAKTPTARYLLIQAAFEAALAMHALTSAFSDGRKLVCSKSCAHSDWRSNATIRASPPERTDEKRCADIRCRGAPFPRLLIPACCLRPARKNCQEP